MAGAEPPDAGRSPEISPVPSSHHHSVARRSAAFYSTVRDAARTAAAAALDLLLPVACVSCDQPLDANETGIVCGRCWSRVGWLPFPQCPRCGHPVARYSCRWCELLPPYVRAVRSACWVPDGVGGTLVHALKYQGWTRLGDALGERMSHLSWPADVVREWALLVPVPLTRARARTRGYNQSLLLARALERHWRVPVSEALIRGGEAASQTQLTPGERRRNVSGAFRVRAEHPSGRAGAALAGSHIVLVDDVVTTAATLNSCAAVLFEGGARIISYVTFGRARAAGDRL